MLQGLRSRHSRAELERVQQTHEMIFEGIRAKDSDRAAEMMTVHFEEAIIALLRDNDQNVIIERKNFRV